MAYRTLIAVFLSLVDIGIAAVLAWRYRPRAALLFVFCPVSIIITGYHNQFDNVAVLLVLASAACAGHRVRGRLDRRDAAAIGLLALSLITKHIYFLFPLWMAARQRTPARRVAYLLVPPAFFALSFVPYWSGGSEGIRDNVFGYRSSENAPLVDGVLPDVLGNAIDPTLVFLAALVAGAALFVRVPLMDAVLIYGVMVVVFAPAIANQYLAICIAAIAAFPNPLFAAYVALSTWFLAINPAELHIDAFARASPERMRGVVEPERQFDWIILALAAGGMWWALRQRISARASPRETELSEPA